MTAILSALVMAAALAVAFASTLQSDQGPVNYPALVTGIALLRMLLWLVLLVRRRVPVTAAGVPDPEDGATATGVGPLQQTRLLGFALLWTGYALLLPVLGFLLASAIALILSLWIANGHFSVRASLASITFILVLSVLVSTVLYIPVPKSGIDHYLDETIFTILGG